MKERPILFSGPMVKAILDGRKTQTRRIVKPQPEGPDRQIAAGFDCAIHGANTTNCHFSLFNTRENADAHSAASQYKCPYGAPGDHLWVRETFTTYKSSTDEENAARMAAAESVKSLGDLYKWSEMPSSGGPVKVLYKADFGDWADNPDSDLGPWKPSIHMPRWASRITLVVKSVRVERLNDISIADCWAEGRAIPADIDDGHAAQARESRESRRWYRELWESINGPGSWDSNPWVWVITFERAQP